MLRVPAASSLHAPGPHPLHPKPIAGGRPGRRPGLLVQAAASRNRKQTKANQPRANATDARPAGTGFGHSDKGATLSQHIAHASERHSQQQREEQLQQQVHDGRGADSHAHAGQQHNAAASLDLEQQLEEIKADINQTELQTKQALEEAAHGGPVLEKPQPPQREAVLQAQPHEVIVTKGIGFSRSSDSSSSDQKESREEAHEKLLHAQELPQKRTGPEGVGQANLAKEGDDRAQAPYPRTQGAEVTKQGPGGLPERPKTETAADGTAAGGRSPAPAAGGLQEAELRGNTGTQHYAALEQAAGETAGSGRGSGSATEGKDSQFAALGDVTGGALDKAEGAAKQAASAVKEGAKEAGDAAVAAANKAGELGGKLADKAAPVAHDVEEAAVSAANKAGDAAVAAANKAGEVGSRVADKAEPVLHDAEQAAVDIANKTGDVAVAAANKLGEVGSEVVETVKPVVQEVGSAAAAAASKAGDVAVAAANKLGDAGSRVVDTVKPLAQEAVASVRGAVGGEQHPSLLSISPMVQRTAAAADRLAAVLAGKQPSQVSSASEQVPSSSAGFEEQLRAAEASRAKVAQAIDRAQERLARLKKQLAQQGSAADSFAASEVPAGAALAGGPVGGSSSAAAPPTGLRGQIMALEADLNEAQSVLNELDDVVGRAKAAKAAAGTGAGTNIAGGSSRVVGKGGAGGSGGGDGGSGGAGGRGGSSGRGGEGAGGAGGAGVPDWVWLGLALPLAYFAYSKTLGKKREEPQEAVEQGVEAAKHKGKKAKEGAKEAAGKAQQLGGSWLDTAKDKAGDAKGKAKDLAADAKGKAQEVRGKAEKAAAEAKGKAEKVAADAKGKAKEIVYDAKGKALSVKERAVEKAAQVKDKAGEAASSALSTIKREGGRKDTWLAALGVIVGLGLIFGAGSGGDDKGSGHDERGYARENAAWRGKAGSRGKQVGEEVSGAISGVATTAPADDKFADYAEAYREGLAAGDSAVAGGNNEQ